MELPIAQRSVMADPSRIVETCQTDHSSLCLQDDEVSGDPLPVLPGPDTAGGLEPGSGCVSNDETRVPLCRTVMVTTLKPRMMSCQSMLNTPAWLCQHLCLGLSLGLSWMSVTW